MTSPARIEICGGIASGKTTLATRLGRVLDCALVLEQFRENPFWKRYYEQPEVFRPEKDVYFIAQHTGALKVPEAPLTVCDYATIQDLAYAQLSRDEGHVALMRHLYQRLYEPLPRPTLIVHLRCEEAVLLERIRTRGRAEEAAIDVAYLRALARGIDEILPAIEAPVLAVRSDEIDFVADTRSAQELCETIRGLVSDLTD
jgi:deoxyguanosine kinase